MVTLAAAIGGIGGAALFAWEYGSRERDAKGRLEYLRALAQHYGERMLVIHGLLKQAGPAPAERCAWRGHCRTDVMKEISFRGTEITVVLTDGRRMVISPRHASAPGADVGWKCVSDLPDGLRPALCSAQ